MAGVWGGGHGFMDVNPVFLATEQRQAEVLVATFKTGDSEPLSGAGRIELRFKVTHSEVHLYFVTSVEEMAWVGLLKPLGESLLWSPLVWTSHAF